MYSLVNFDIRGTLVTAPSSSLRLCSLVEGHKQHIEVPCRKQLGYWTENDVIRQASLREEGCV